MDIAMNDDAAERAEALSGNKSDIALCEIVRFGVMGTSKNSSVRGVSVIDTDNWLSRLTFSAI